MSMTIVCVYSGKNDPQLTIYNTTNFID